MTPIVDQLDQDEQERVLTAARLSLLLRSSKRLSVHTDIGPDALFDRAE